MNFNIDYLMQHISYELHTIVKNWTDTLSSQTKPEVVCTRKDISDEYLPFSVFTDSILNAEDTFNPVSYTHLQLRNQRNQSQQYENASCGLRR